MNKQSLKTKTLLLSLPIAALGLLSATPSSAGSLFDTLIDTVRDGASALPFLGRGPQQRPAPTESQDFQVPSLPASTAPQTSDSSFLIRESVDPSSVLMQIVVTPKGQESLKEMVFAPIEHGQLEKRIYLLHGQGTYTVNMWQSRDPNRYQSGQKMVYVKSFEIVNTDPRDMSFLLPTGDVQSDSPEIVSLAKEITTHSLSDAEKALAIHDWVAGNIAYDSDAYFSGNYISKVFDALQTLHSHQGVCQGYSSLYAALARAAGLRTKIINGSIIWPGQTWDAVGNSQTHAWNEVLVDGRWIILDTTWDSGGMDFSTHQFMPSLSHKYYDPDPTQFNQDHHKLSDISDQ